MENGAYASKHVFCNNPHKEKQFGKVIVMAKFVNQRVIYKCTLHNSVYYTKMYNSVHCTKVQGDFTIIILNVIFCNTLYTCKVLFVNV